MTSRQALIPDRFGPLQGMRFISTGFYIAQPFAASLAAEMGAEVIHVERPRLGDPLRMTDRDGAYGLHFMQERRNMLSVTLDFSKPRGRELFLKLLGSADVWMESSKPGSLKKFGLDDDSILAANPRLVIVHVSGYGQSGDPDYVSRPGYDSIGQAFSGMMYMNGFPDGPPYRAQPDTGDYMTASYALWASLAAHIRVLHGGKGQSIDVSIFEVVHKHLGLTMLDYFQNGRVRERNGNKSPLNQPMDCFQARDGWVMIVAMYAQYDRVCEVIGLDPTDRKWQYAHIGHIDSPEGLEFDATLRRWVGARSAEEATRILTAAGVPCSKVMSARDIAEDPHARARELHVEWEDGQAGRVKGVGVVPKFSGTPGKIWRGAPALGQDNALVYGKLLGLQAGELEQLAQDGII